tara:strand:+ start:131 stop:526 length:396 start_codon:yes stop_codon:yes gene_type:complete
MASILRVNTLTDASSNNSTPMATVNQGTAKAWTHFQGTSTAALINSFNMASLTDTEAGRFTLNFTSNFGDASYAGSMMVGNDGTTSVGRSQMIDATPTTSAFAIRAVSSNGDANSLTDDPNMLATLHGDSA